MITIFGSLTVVPALSRPELLSDPTRTFLSGLANAEDFGVAEIDPSFSDTAAFCKKYQIRPDQVANCVIVKASRGEKVTYAACMILGSSRADVNGFIRRHLDARKASFAPMDEAVSLTKMECGGITPVGVPSGWPILIDRAVADSAAVIIGSGIRGSKIVLSGNALASLPGAFVSDGIAVVQ